MSDIYKPIGDDRDVSSSAAYGAGASNAYDAKSSGNDTGRALLAAVVGGLVSGAGYLVYSRLPDDQREKLHGQVRQLVDSRVNELRGRFNI